MKIKLPSFQSFFAAISVGQRILEAIADHDITAGPIPLGEILILKQSGKRIYLDASLVVRNA